MDMKEIKRFLRKALHYKLNPFLMHCPECGKMHSENSPYKGAFSHTCSQECARLSFVECCARPNPVRSMYLCGDNYPLHCEVWNSLHGVSLADRKIVLKRIFKDFSKEDLMNRIKIRFQMGLPDRFWADFTEEGLIPLPGRESPATILALELLYGVSPESVFSGDQWIGDQWFPLRYRWEAGDLRWHAGDPGTWDTDTEKDGRFEKSIRALYGAESIEYKDAMKMLKQWRREQAWRNL